MTRRDKVLVEHRDSIRAAARRNKARSIALVGSVARGDDTADSDYDFLIEFEPRTSLFDLARLQAELEDLLGGEVDIVNAARLRDSHRGMAGDAIAL